MATRALIREADLMRILHASKKAGVEVRVEIEPGRVVVTTGKPASIPSTNPLDDMFG